MLQAGIEKERRAKIANQLLTFIESPDFKNPIEDLVHTAKRLRDGIQEEFRWHRSDWNKRLAAYERIRWDGSGIQENLQRVFRGEVPKPMLSTRQKLALPAPTGTLIGEIAATGTHATKAGGR